MTQNHYFRRNYLILFLILTRTRRQRYRRYATYKVRIRRSIQDLDPHGYTIIDMQHEVWKCETQFLLICGENNTGAGIGSFIVVFTIFPFFSSIYLHLFLYLQNFISLHIYTNYRTLSNTYRKRGFANNCKWPADGSR